MLLGISIALCGVVPLTYAGEAPDIANFAMMIAIGVLPIVLGIYLTMLGFRNLMRGVKGRVLETSE